MSFFDSQLVLLVLFLPLHHHWSFNAFSASPSLFSPPLSRKFGSHCLIVFINSVEFKNSWPNHSCFEFRTWDVELPVIYSQFLANSSSLEFGNWNRNSPRSYFWDLHWACACQLLANFFPATSNIPRSLCERLLYKVDDGNGNVKKK